MPITGRQWAVAAGGAVVIHAAIAAAWIYQAASAAPVQQGNEGMSIMLSQVVELPAEPEPEPEPEPKPPEPKPEPKPEPEPKPVKKVRKPPPKPAPAPMPMPTLVPQKQETAPPPAKPSPTLGDKRPSPPPNYQAMLQAVFERYKVYPRAARLRRQEGVVVLKVTMARSGRVLSRAIASSSGKALLDEAALELADKVSPLPPLPADVAGDTYTFTVPIQYALR